MKTVSKKFAVLAGLCLAFTGAALAELPGDWKGRLHRPPKERSTAGVPDRVDVATGLVGTPVKNRKDEELGEVKDVIIKLKGKRVIYYAVLAVNDAAGAEKLVTVPLTDFVSGADRSHLVLNATRESLSRNPKENYEIYQN